MDCKINVEYLPEIITLANDKLRVLFASKDPIKPRDLCHLVGELAITPPHPTHQERPPFK